MSSRNDFLIALQFMTRLPVKAELDYSEDRFARSARFYPAVGLVVGGITGVVYYLTWLFLPENVASIIAVLTAVALTAGLHEDGLADAADGLIGGRDRDHALDIMRDHQVGVYGALALIFAVGLQWAVLFDWPNWSVIWALIAGHALSRHAIAEVIGRYDYARPDPAKFARPSLGGEDLTYARLWALSTLVGAVFLLGFWSTLTGLVFAGLLGSGLAQVVQRKLGGYTGDCLGAVQQVTLIGFLLGASVWA